MCHFNSIFFFSERVSFRSEMTFNVENGYIWGKTPSLLWAREFYFQHLNKKRWMNFIIRYLMWRYTYVKCSWTGGDTKNKENGTAIITTEASLRLWLWYFDESADVEKDKKIIWEMTLFLSLSPFLFLFFFQTTWFGCPIRRIKRTDKDRKNAKFT